MKARCISIPKDPAYANEDAVRAGVGLLAVSDGAGGGGVFADKWSAWLLEHLPAEAITTFAQLDAWLDGIWEPFYQFCEDEAKRQGGMVLSKFYDEGSFATLAAAWVQDGVCRWAAYGDSVVMCYRDGQLLHSFTAIEDFDKPPYLISLHHPLRPEGFRSGKWSVGDDCVLLVASDALARYILTMHREMPRDKFQRLVVNRLLHCVGHRLNMMRHLQGRLRRRLLRLDDCSLAAMW